MQPSDFGQRGVHGLSNEGRIAFPQKWQLLRQRELEYPPDRNEDPGSMIAETIAETIIDFAFHKGRWWVKLLVFIALAALGYFLVR